MLKFNFGHYELTNRPQLFPGAADFANGVCVLVCRFKNMHPSSSVSGDSCLSLLKSL